MARPEDDDDRTLPDAVAPSAPAPRPSETFDDDSPLGFVPARKDTKIPKPLPTPKPSVVPPLLRGLSMTPKPLPVAPRPTPAPAPIPEPEPEPEPEELALEEWMDPDDVVREWVRSLDAIDYLSLLNLPRDAEPSDERVREAWRAFALAFHPDRHRDAPDDVWASTTRVFQRGAEAYRVLQDPVLRRRYLELLEREGVLRLTPGQIEKAKAEGDARSARDLVSSPAARAFAEKADELLAAGKLEAARLQLQLALMREAGNERLANLLRQLEQRIAATRPTR